ncbi:MAG: LytR C-terminal domain-containing protein [Elusimicrobiota bacterium]|jgi:hypothetical protein
MNRGLLAALALLVPALAAALLELSSPFCAGLRAGRPSAGFVALRTAGSDPSAPPALYAAVLGPSSRTLDLLELPASTPAPGGTLASACRAAGPRACARAMAGAARGFLDAQPGWAWRTPPPFLLEIDLPSGAASDPFGAASRLTSAVSDPLFVARLPLRLRALRAVRREGLGRYDLLRLTLAAARLRPGGVALARLVDPRLAPTLLAGVAARLEGRSLAEATLTVEVLNGSDSGGVALRATKILRWRGIDVVHFGNAPTMEPRVRVVVRSGRSEAAAEVLDALGCPDAEVLTELEPEPRAAVSLVIGQDYARCARLTEDSPF